jgi:copper(I)-binding protein
MKNFITFFALIVFTQNSASANDSVIVGNLTITSAWSRASTGINRPSAVYLSIANNSFVRDLLISAHTRTAKRAELHRHFMDNGVMKMRQVDFMEVPANGMTMLKPSGSHIMLFSLKSLLKEGDMFPMSLKFEKAGKATVVVHVAGVGSSKAHKKSHNKFYGLKSNGHKKHGSAPDQ